MKRKLLLFVAVAVFVVSLYALEGIRISVWSGTQGLAEASVQVYLAGLLTPFAVAFVLGILWFAGSDNIENKE